LSAALSMAAAGGLAAGEHRLAAGPMRAVVRAGAGGRIAAAWREEPKGRRTDLLQPMPAGDFDPCAWPKGGCYPLVPWSNRIRDGRFVFRGRTVDLDYPSALPHGLHGFAQRGSWQVTAVTETDLTMIFRHAAAPGWPWTFEATQRVLLDGAGLTLEIAVTNTGTEPMPAGLGVHPYLACGAGDRLRLTAAVLWERDADMCATVARQLDAAAGRRDDTLGADETVYLAGFEGVASLARHDGSRVVLETGAPFDHLVLHVPAGAPYACVEPVTHVADAFNLAAAGVGGSGFRVLEPGESLAGVVRMGLA
jgi:aldose 1-epimerase